MKNTSESSGDKSRLSAWTVTMSRPVLTLVVAGWLILFANLPFWHTIWAGIGGWSNGNPIFIASLPIFALMWTFIVLSVLAWGRLTKAVLAIALVVSAAASYFMSSYGILIDADMLTNVLQTDPSEATELVTVQMVAWIVGLGVIPALLLTRVRVVKRSIGRELTMKLASIVVAVACIGGIAMTEYQSYASLFRNHREIRLMLTPSNVVSAVHSYVRNEFKAPSKLEVVGADAHRILEVGTNRKPRLTIVMVGETARAANFGLDGYERNTSPELAKEGVLNFTHVSSCGTATAVSVPCMFQDVGRDEYKSAYAKNREGLLDVLQRAGVGVLWRDNNSGCKGACDRVPTEDVSHFKLADFCAGGECHDDALLSGLQDYIDTLKDDTVVVLHMKGSHGPFYAKRYPAAYGKFTPVCQSSQLDQCSRESIVNAYDNSLLYTDHVVAETVRLLKKNQSNFDTALMYLSDHGESLGENGVYLHGLPYAMAPQEQTHIPMVVWLSEGIKSHNGIQSQCMAALKDQPFSQDNLFHSVLDLMAVQTSVYRPELDMFRNCKGVNQASITSPESAEAIN